MTNATDHLATLERLGAQQFRDTSLSSDHSGVTRAVRKHRTVRAGVGTFAGLGLVGAGAYGFTQVDGVGDPIAPGATNSASPSPSPSVSVGPSTSPAAVPTPVEDSVTIAPGSTADAPGRTTNDAVAGFATAWGIPEQQAHSIMTRAWENLLPEAAEGETFEGWLAPGTYPTEGQDWEGPEQMAAAMMWQTVLTLEENGIPEDRWLEVLTIASLVEREARLEEDMSRVSAVIHNRLESGQNLELNSTIHYLTGSDDTFTSAEDRALDFPYNTYRNRGLPPGPISTVSPEAIAAAASPANGDWLYFVTVNLETGETLFAEDFEQHQENVTKLGEWIRENED